VRVLLVVGKGGVGKTTIAAASALAAADAGLRTLVVSTDPAHSLGDVLGLSSGRARVGDWRGGPTPEVVAGTTLDALQVDARAQVDSAWPALAAVLSGLLDGAGLDPLVADEVATLPGVEDVLALSEIGRLAPEYDAVVVDCAPTAETLRLLALPEALERMIARAFPLERRIETLVSGDGLGDAAVASLEALDGLGAQLREVRSLLVGPHAAVRLVATPEQVVLAETRRARATLALLGHHVEGLVLNRVAAGEGWPPELVARHRAALLAAREELAGLPIRHAPYRAAEPVGVPALRALGAEVLAGADPLDLGAATSPSGLRPDGSGWRLDVAVPGAGSDDVAVAVTDRGDLVVQLGPHRRVLELPPVLRRCEVSGAHMRPAEGVVSIEFRPDDRVYTLDRAGEQEEAR
jgi:arsenite-transporting ATPase